MSDQVHELGIDAWLLCRYAAGVFIIIALVPK